MGWLRKTRRDDTWSFPPSCAPWEQRTSIYEHIRTHIDPETQRLTEDGDRLPDEDEDGDVRIVSGGRDGMSGHHHADSADGARAALLHRALGAVLGNASQQTLAKLYQLLLQESILDEIDLLLEQIADAQDLDATRLERLAVWIARGASDREPVKFAIALLGVAARSDHRELLLTLGTHEEFTLYVGGALQNVAGRDADPEIFELAQRVTGWGRIQLVEKLAGTTDPAIKAWLLRDGYRNAVMQEYLAFTCAVAGDLATALEGDTIDPDLLRGAGEMIRALVAGGPAEDMDDYVDAALVVSRYLHHLGDNPTRVAELLVLASIESFLHEDAADWLERAERGWSSGLRQTLSAKVRALRALPHWRATITADLEAADREKFYSAHQAAEMMGMDTWHQHLARIQRGVDDGWAFVLDTDDPARVDLALALAERSIRLTFVTKEAGHQAGRAPTWMESLDLIFVLQALPRWPGRGWCFIRAGIECPFVGVRLKALRALSVWERNEWPAHARGLLEHALAQEPDQDVRGDLERLLAGGN